MKNHQTLICAVLFVALLFGCEKSKNPAAPTHAIQIQNITATPSSFMSGNLEAHTSITVIASTTNNRPLHYHWTCSSGEFRPDSTATVLWYCFGNYGIWYYYPKVTITDSSDTVSDSVTVTVTNL